MSSAGKTELQLSYVTVIGFELHTQLHDAFSSDLKLFLGVESQGSWREMKTQTQTCSLINKYTSVLFNFIYICKQVNVFTNKKHCLSKLLAQICTKMGEWVRNNPLRSNQSEVQSLEYYG